MNTASFNTYLSNHIYDSLVTKDHFLRQLNELFDWYELTFDLRMLGKNDHGGRPRWHPQMMFKILLLSFLFDTSDRDTAELCTANLRCKYFIGLSITEEAPDFTTISYFRNEIIKQMGEGWLKQTFEKIIDGAKEAGISFGQVFALDATHTLSDVDTHQDKERQAQGQPARDEEARWGAKGSETRLTRAGEKVEVVKYFHGYKAHLLAETDQGIVTALKVTPGNTADVDAGEDLLIKQLTAKQRQEISMVTADKAYGDGVLIGILERDYGVQTALGLNGQFFKGRYREHWQAYRDDPVRVSAKKKRSVIERVNADLKDNHGLRRCRYLGLPKYYFQTVMAALSHNLKIMVTQLTGARLRPA